MAIVAFEKLEVGDFVKFTNSTDDVIAQWFYGTKADALSNFQNGVYDLHFTAAVIRKFNNKMIQFLIVDSKNDLLRKEEFTLNWGYNFGSIEVLGTVTESEVDNLRVGKLAENLVEDHTEFMRELCARRALKGLSQQEVAERMGVSLQSVQEFEAYDSNPRLSEIRRYALAVDAAVITTVNDYYG